MQEQQKGAKRRKRGLEEVQRDQLQREIEAAKLMRNYFRQVFLTPEGKKVLGVILAVCSRPLTKQGEQTTPVSGEQVKSFILEYLVEESFFSN